MCTEQENTTPKGTGLFSKVLIALNNKVKKTDETSV